MILEQPAALNRYQPTYRKGLGLSRVYVVLLPVLAIPWMLCAELVFIAPLLGKKKAMDPLLGLLLDTVFYLVLAPVLIAITIKIQQRSPRKLVIDAKGFKASVTGAGYIRWSDLMIWWLEPAPGSAEFLRLIMIGRFRRNKRSTLWSMILKSPEQTDLLKAELAQIRQTGVAVPELRESSEAASDNSRSGLRQFWPNLLGLLFLLHAFIFLMFGYAVRKSNGENPHWTISGRSDSPLIRFVSQHFSSLEQFRSILLITGTCFLILGIVFMAWSVKVSKESLRKNPALQPP